MASIYRIKAGVLTFSSREGRGKLRRSSRARLCAGVRSLHAPNAANSVWSKAVGAPRCRSHARVSTKEGGLFTREGGLFTREGG